MRIALVGTRGIPANYGGFETFAEELSTRLAARGHEVTVYCRQRFREPRYRGVRLQYLPTIRHKYLDTLAHTFLSTLHLAAHRVDVALYCNGANALFTLGPRMLGMPVALNVDGIERRRKKWNRLAKAWYLWSEWLTTFCPTAVVTDARTIQDYYRRRYRKESVFIPYGADTGSDAGVDAGPGAGANAGSAVGPNAGANAGCAVGPDTGPDAGVGAGSAISRDTGPDAGPSARKAAGCGTLAALGLEPGRYFLYVSRMEPENHPLEVRQAFETVDTPFHLALVGDAPYARDYIRRVRDTRDARIVIPGAIYGEGYRELGSHSFAYVHATEVGGTHPALIEAMGRGALVLYRNTPENAEVAGDAGIPFEPEELAAKMQSLLEMPEEERDAFRRKALARARERYSWDAVTDAYEGLLGRLAG